MAGFLDQLRQATPEAETSGGTLPATLEVEVERPPLDPSDPLPAYPFCVHSRILDSKVWIVSDGWTGELSGAVYRHSEIEALVRQGVTPEALRAIHRVKTEFDGEVLR